LVKENAILQRKLVKLRNGGHENNFASTFGLIDAVKNGKDGFT
jgi:hypothetical protein